MKANYVRKVKLVFRGSTLAGDGFCLPDVQPPRLPQLKRRSLTYSARLGSFTSMKKNPDTAVKSATRTLDLLELVGTSKVSLTFGEIGAKLAIPNSSLFYLLSTLCQRGYLVLDPVRNSYALGPAVRTLIAKRRATQNWAALAVPLLDRITSSVNETSTYSEQRGDEIECIGATLATQTLLPVLRVGERSPLYAFSGGKLLLAHMDDVVVEAYLARTPLKKFTVNTLVNKAAIRKELQEIRARGISYSRQEHTLGVIGISVAARAGEQIVGSFGVAIAAPRFSRQVESAVCRQLQLAARRFAELSSSEAATASSAQKRSKSTVLSFSADDKTLATVPTV